MAIYEKDPKTGNVHVKIIPIVWTPEQWAGKIGVMEQRLFLAQEQLATAMAPKDKPDADTLALWNSMAAEQRRPLEEEVANLRAELEEMKMKAV